MRFVSGNKAIRDHKTTGKSLHLFEQDKKDKRMLLYLGEMEYADHEVRPAPDKDGKIRDAIVFRLRPVGSLSPDSAGGRFRLA
jgi:5-methylcytosine-specific restriction enzyme A